MLMGIIYLIRHGRTQWNKEKIFRGQADIPLDTCGKHQAQALGTTLSRIISKRPLFITSPLERAKETAEIVSSFFQSGNINIDEHFLDISYGNWEGCSREEIEKNYPELFQTWANNPERVTFPGKGENLITVAHRAERGIYQIAEKNPEGTTLIFAHQAVNKALLCRLLGAGEQAFWKIGQDNACWNLLSHNASFFVVTQLNETCHLGSMSEAE